MTSNKVKDGKPTGAMKLNNIKHSTNTKPEYAKNKKTMKTKTSKIFDTVSHGESDKLNALDASLFGVKQPKPRNKTSGKDNANMTVDVVNNGSRDVKSDKVNLYDKSDTSNLIEKEGNINSIDAKEDKANLTDDTGNLSRDVKNETTNLVDKDGNNVIRDTKRGLSNVTDNEGVRDTDKPVLIDKEGNLQSRDVKNVIDKGNNAINQNDNVLINVAGIDNANIHKTLVFILYIVNIIKYLCIYECKRLILIYIYIIEYIILINKLNIRSTNNYIHLYIYILFNFIFILIFYVFNIIN